MNYLKQKKENNFKSQKGIGVPELIVVLLVISIVVAIALPQILSSRRLFSFAGMQREMVTLLRETRQDAMSQRRPITFRYQQSQTNIVIYGGSFGSFGASANKVYQLDGLGVSSTEIIYGRPVFAPTSPLKDGTNLTALTGGMLEITFQADGTVVDGSNNPQDTALFFYNQKHPIETAFAVSVLGAGGRVKVWRYNQGVNKYVE